MQYRIKFSVEKYSSISGWSTSEVEKETEADTIEQAITNASQRVFVDFCPNGFGRVNFTFVSIQQLTV